MISPSQALYEAVFKRLLQDTELTQLLGSDRIFDRIPERVSPPYCVVGSMRSDDWSTATEEGAAITFMVHCWSDASSRQECEIILAKTSRCLLSLDTLQGHELVQLRMQFSEIRRDRNSAHFLGVTRFRGVTEPLPDGQN